MYLNEPHLEPGVPVANACNSTGCSSHTGKLLIRHLKASYHSHLSEGEGGVEIQSDNFVNKPNPHNTFELSWNYAQDGKVEVDQNLMTVIDANPAFAEMIGYTRDELVGMQAKYMHPKSEHEQVTTNFRRDSSHAAIHTGLHLLRKDGSLLPVQIWASESLDFDGRTVAVVEFRDMTDQLQNENELKAKNWALSAFSGAALALSQTESEAELLQAICEAITRESAYSLAAVVIAGDDPNKAHHLAATAGAAINEEHLKEGEGMSSWDSPSGICIRTKKNYIVDDFETDSYLEHFRDAAKKMDVRSLAAIPLFVEGAWTGALIVVSGEQGVFGAEPMAVFSRLGEQMVHGIESLRRKAELEAERHNLEVARRHLTEVLGSTVGAMVKAMEMRDPYTAGHEGRVAEISVAIGREMGWDEGKLLGIRLAAMVHDIGKIAIPAEILTRPGKLNEAEFMLVKAHAETGHSILKDVPFTWPVATMVKQHHERLDGTGYPLGIRGDEILIESRVLAVADMVEAMASDRPYRRAWGLEYALRQVESEAGTKLDAEVVRICAELFREKRLVVAGLEWN